VLDAHWLSDVLGGIAVGYAAAVITRAALGIG
jgi:membrane-associated phospholipid phosphatase